MWLKNYFLSLLLLFSINPVFSQTFKISGTIVDYSDASSLPGVGVILSQANDSTKWKGVATDINGKFEFNSVNPGNYKLKTSFVGYKNSELPVTVAGKDMELGTLKMEQSVTQLKSVKIEAQQIRSEQKEDTVQYNANAYKTNPDANAEDLVTKMPGITSDNGSVKAHGEDVKQVLVDGKPFFGDDPTSALKNLPAEVIDKIQVFDQLSDQSQFTGFDDGQSSKTINIITKAGKNNGQFGKIYAGYGDDNRYLAGGNVNLFKGNQRISLIGLSNNINQQNFSSQDLLGLTGSSGNSGRGGFGGRGGGGSGGSGRGGGGQGGNSASNFLVGQQGGTSTTNSAGFNYSDTWGKKIKVTGSYFFNSSDNTNITSLARNYILPSDSGLLYNENSNSETKNFNHRINFRFEYAMDSLNSLIITPKLNFQTNDATSILHGINTKPGNLTLSQTDNNTISNNNGYNLSNNILYRHRFEKRGRTISLGVTTSLNNKDGTGKNYSNSQYYTLNDSDVTDLESTQHTDGYTVSGNLAYTEPVGTKGQLQFNYSPSYTKNNTDKETDNLDVTGENYTLLDTALSNKYNNTYLVNKGGAGYRYNGTNFNIMTGVNFQHAALSGNEIFPSAFNVDKTFINVLPQALFNYKFTDGRNLRVMYRTSTDVPSVTQLQNVINNNNPLLLSTGNPDLKQDFQHTMIIRYGKTNAEKATGLFVFLYGNYMQDYIANSTIIPVHDTVLNEAIVLHPGSQLTLPVNLQGYWNARTFITYALPLNFIKSNLNLSSGLTFTRTPALINDKINIANNYTVSKGFVLSSNISENVDFNLSSTANYSIVNNTLQSGNNDNYFYNIASLKFNWILLKTHYL